MTKLYLLLALAVLTATFSANAQNNCNTQPPVVQPYASPVLVCGNNPTPAPVLAQQGTVLPTLEYLIVVRDSVPGQDVVVGASPDGVYIPANLPGVRPGSEICVIPVRYDINQMRTLVDSLFLGNLGGLPCCTLVDLILAGTCNSLNTYGIYGAADVVDLNNALDILRVLDNPIITVLSFIGSITTINAQGGVLPAACGGGVLPICFAMDSTQRACITYGVANEVTTTAATTPNGTDGTATATPQTGTGPFTFSWSNGATSQTATGLAEGTYYVTITDANGCVGWGDVFVADVCTNFTGGITVNGISCHNENDGFIAVFPTGGTAPYTVTWYDGGINTLNAGGFTSRSSLSAGAYSLTVSDGIGCTTTYSEAIVNPDLLVATANTSGFTYNLGDPSLVFTANGIAGGTAPYSYRWNFGDGTPPAFTQTASHSFANVGAFQVILVVTDIRGCTVSDTISIAVTGLSNIQTLPVQAFPNPTNSTLRLSGLENGWAVSMSDALGRVVLMDQALGGEMLISVEAVPEGIYFLHVSSAEGFATLRIVVRK